MINKALELFRRYREIILYVFFGGMTTLVDWVISFLLYALEVNVHAANVLAWCAAVLFAFVTNRAWVFESKTRGARLIFSELLAFSGGRIATLLLQEAMVFALFDCLSWNKYAVKIIAAVLVVILNYFISKFWVFRKK